VASRIAYEVLKNDLKLLAYQHILNRSMQPKGVVFCIQSNFVEVLTHAISDHVVYS